MPNIKVNHIFWEALSEQEKSCITDHLKKFGVLAKDQMIVADMETPPPVVDIPHSPATINAMLIDWICYSICHSACDSSCCSKMSQDVNTCLNAIRTDREAHRNQNQPGDTPE